MSVDYNVYRKEILNFLNTVSIKFSPFDEYGKEFALTKGIIVNYDYENPYYLNLCGLYSDADDPILINAVETGEQVTLTRDIAKLFPKTASIYRIPNEEYVTLCLKYPKQQGLIKSIIYPAKDIDTVLAARDLTVLSYDESLLEENERESLITAMTEFLDLVYNRWYIKDYRYEKLFPIAFMGIIYGILPSVLLAQRIRNLRTDQVHSLHIWEYLSSKGLKDYQSILNQKQSLFLYRNIDYLLRNKGKKSNIEILGKNLLKDLHISLVGKTILQQTDDRYDECITIPEFLSDSVVQSGTIEQIDEDSKQSMSDILFRINQEGYYPGLSVEDTEHMELKFGSTELNSLPTRLLEFEKSILNTTYIPVLTRFLIDTLIYQYSCGSITYRHKFIDVNTNLPMDLDVGDMLVLLYYTHFKESGITPTIVPERYTTHIPYYTIRPTNIPETFIFNNFEYKLDSIVDVNQIVSDIFFDPGPFTSLQSFLSRAANQFSTMMKHIRHNRQNGSTVFQRAIEYLYSYLTVHRTIDVPFSKHTTYAAWIAETPGISNLINAYDDLPNSKEYYKILCDNIWAQLFPVDSFEMFEEFTGANKDSTAIYAGLKKLFIQLCSYRLFFLETDRKSTTFLISPYSAMWTYSGKDSSGSSVSIGSDLKSYVRDYNTIKLTDSVMLVNDTATDHDTTTESGDICFTLEDHKDTSLLRLNTNTTTMSCVDTSFHVSTKLQVGNNLKPLTLIGD